VSLARSGYYNVKYEWNELERTKTEELCEDCPRCRGRIIKTIRRVFHALESAKPVDNSAVKLAVSP